MIHLETSFCARLMIFFLRIPSESSINLSDKPIIYE
jgi:hypothetical protein